MVRALPLPRGPRLEPACQNLLTVLSPPTRVLGSNGMLGGRQLPIFGGPAPDFQPTFTESQLCARPGARGLLSLSTPGIRAPSFFAMETTTLCTLGCSAASLASAY